MSSNRLRLNASKTQFIWLGNGQQLRKIDPQAISADFPNFVFSTSVRNLGIVLDQELTFSEHLNLLCRACFFQLRQLRVISRSLSPNAALTVVHAFVCSRIDYCSTIYAGLPLGRIAQVEHVLRAAARLVGGFLNLTISRIICVTYSTGFLFLSAFNLGFRSGSGGAN